MQCENEPGYGCALHAVQCENEPGYGCALYTVQRETHTAQHTMHNHKQALSKQLTTHTQNMTCCHSTKLT